MRGVRQALPLGAESESGRGGPRRRASGAASRQLSFGFEGKGGASRPNGAPPNVAQPSVPTPNVAQPNVAPPNVAPPNVAPPNVAQPSVPPPSVPPPSVAQPSLAAPAAATPLLAVAVTPVQVAPASVAQPSAPSAPPARDEDAVRSELEQRLHAMLGVRVEVQLTRNRRTMISSARAGTALRLRLHRMFVEADGAIVEALGRYVKTGDRRASRRLGEFIEAQRERFVAPRPPRALRPHGEHHDLAAMFARLEARYFPGALEGVTITWGRHGNAARGRRRKRSVRLGTYTHDERLIRVHPVLDQPWVPAFFVEYIVFHEMLHHVEPAREEGGRTIFHTPEFRRRERAYPDYHSAIAWERANISRLLS